MKLIEQLTQSLDIKEDQAKGGAGLIFQLAKQQLGNSEFNQIASVIPTLEDLLNSAPQQGSGVMGAIGGLASTFGGDTLGKVAGLASLAGGFRQLGLNPEIISQFVPIILSFVQKQGGEEARGLLARVLK